LSKKYQRESRWQAEPEENGGDMFIRNVGSLSTDYTRRYIPEDVTLHNHRCANLKSYMYTEEFNDF
jgi:hypothetical protein